MLKEEVELWRRDPVECVRELIGNPTFQAQMRYAPEKVYTSEQQEDWKFDNMWTSEWWWETQVRADAPEPEACAYISSGPAGPTLERKQEHPHLKAWATDPTLPK